LRSSRRQENRGTPGFAQAPGRLIGAVLLEINDDRVIQSRYIEIKGMAERAAMPDKNDAIAVPPKAA
jgi:hypothetical protein